MATRHFHYIAFGLRVRSEIPLIEFVRCEPKSNPDVLIRVGAVDRRPVNRALRGCFQANLREAYLYWEEDGAYLVRDGSEIIVDPKLNADSMLLRLVLTGTAFGVLLHQRGLLTLHASAVQIGNHAILFAAAKGHGKSTTAAALSQRGFPILADDVVAIRASDDHACIYPAFPQLKLWTEAAKAIGASTETLKRVHPRLEKYGYRRSFGFHSDPVPIGAIFILSGGDEFRVEELNGVEAFLELVRHSFALRFLGEAGVSSEHFQSCADLANRVSIRRLYRRHGLDALEKLARCIEEDAQEQPSRLEPARRA